MNIYGVGPRLSYSAAITLPFACIFIVALRFYTRKKSKLQLWWDDWLVLPALIAMLGMCATVIAGVALHGVGYPTIDPADTIPTTITRQVIWATYLMGTPLLTCIKVSFVLWYRRIFWQGSTKWYRTALHATVVVLLIWGIAFFFSFLFLCPGHPQAYWGTLMDVKTKCIETAVVYQSYATSDFILDLVVAILPMIPLYSLRMSIKRRLAVMCVFLLGSFTIVASILRMITVWGATAAQYKPGTDIPLILTKATYWGLIECGVAIISCCLPTCSALLRLKYQDKPATTRQGLGAASSGNSARTEDCLSTHYTSTCHSSTSPYDDETKILRHSQPDKIVVTRTFMTQSQRSFCDDLEKHEVTNITEETI